MVIVYTLDSKVNIDKNKRSIIYQYYKESITRAKKLGYQVEIYTNDMYFQKYVDKLHFIERDSILWDSYKFIALSKRSDNFILLDGDVFLDSKVELQKGYDVLFDTYEVGNWNLLYSKEVRKLTQLDVHTIIPEWTNTPQKVMSCGFLYFNDLNFRQIYLDRWLKLEEFITNNQTDLDTYKSTAVAAQYLLTVLVNYYNISVYYYSKDLGIPNQFYTHHAGKGKYSSNLVKGIDKTLL